MQPKDIIVKDIRERIGKLRLAIYNLEQTAALYESDFDLFPPEPKTIRDTVYGILKENGKPMAKQQIHDAVIAAGVTIPGQSPLNNLAAHMSNDARIENAHNDVWALREWRDQSPQMQKLVNDAPSAGNVANSAPTTGGSPNPGQNGVPTGPGPVVVSTP